MRRPPRSLLLLLSALLVVAVVALTGGDSARAVDPPGVPGAPGVPGVVTPEAALPGPTGPLPDLSGPPAAPGSPALPGSPGSSPGTSPRPGSRPAPDPPRPSRPPRTGCPSSSVGQAPHGAATFPCDFPDPMVLRVGRTYYAYGTSTGWQPRGRAFPILRSTDLRHWTRAGDGLMRAPRWSDGDLWGPAVLARRGTYYLYYSAKNRRTRHHCIGVATASRPQGPFRQRRMLACRDRRSVGYIDPHPLIDRRGRGFLFFSVDFPHHSISAIRLDPSLMRTTGRRHELVRARERWHRGLRTRTVEAPTLARRGRRYYLMYSAGSWLSDYRMGYALTARTPLGRYRDGGRNPFLRATGRLASPGGGTLVTGPNRRIWLAFHAWTRAVGYNRGGWRTLRTAPLRFRGRQGIKVGISRRAAQTG